MKHKKLFVSLTAVCSVLIAVAVFLMIWFFGDKYKDFDSDFVKEFNIPGLADGCVPQGMGNCSAEYELTDAEGNIKKLTQQYFFISAYMVDGSPSRIYVTGADTGYIGYVTMKNTDSTDYKGHCGGVALNTSALWVTGEGTVYVAKASSGYTSIAQEIIDKATGKPVEKEVEGENVLADPDKFITFTATFEANCGADFCYYFDHPDYDSKSYDKLYVGEFYRNGNWETDLNHRLETPNGYQNTAFVYEYNIDTSSNNPYGLVRLSDSGLTEENKVPRIYSIISLPERIQGFARVNNALVLSDSYGLANSHILVFDWAKTVTSSNSAKYTELTGVSFEYEGVKRPSGATYTVTDLTVYYADKNNEEILLKDYSIPCMSEGLCNVGNKVYVLFESAGKKYKLFVREQLKNVYSFRVRNS